MQENFRVHYFENIFRSVGRMVKRRHSLESLFHGGSNVFPLVVVECVGFVDLILDADIDVVVLLVATNSLFLRRLFVGGEWEVSLAWNDG